MAVWKRNDTGKYVCDFRHNGQRYVRTIKFARTKKEAEQAEKVIMADVFRQVHGLEGKKDMRFDDLCGRSLFTLCRSKQTLFP